MILDKITMAVSSIGGIELINNAPAPTPTIEYLKLLIQLVIGIVSIFHISKKDKIETPKN
jgi:hypothetical protein